MNIDILNERIAQGESFEYLFFWGHTPSKNGRVNKSCLSQWYESPFTFESITYKTAEHWMMASKARLFKDHEILAQILNADEPKTAKSLGRKVKGFNEQIWDAMSRQFVTDGNILKFDQNPLLKEYLLSTGNAVLVEASPYDKIWGIGLSLDDPKAKNPATWQGKNLLGFTLMDVRTQLQEK